MADLTDVEAAQAIKIAGAAGTGTESYFADVDSSNNLKTVCNNAAGASAVNIQDGGNSITVDGTLTVSSSEAASFTAYAADVAIGNNKSMLSLVNTSGSTVRVKLHGIAIKNVQTTAVTGVIAEFRLFRIVGHSAGTSITPLPHDTTDSLNGSVTTRTGGTVTSEAASYIKRWKWSSDEWGVGSLDVEGSDHAKQELSWIAQPNSNVKPFTLNANEGIHIKQVTNSTAGTFDVEFVFVQI